MAASSGPEAGRGAGAVSFLDSSSTVAEPPRAPEASSSSLLSELGPVQGKTFRDQSGAGPSRFPGCIPTTAQEYRSLLHNLVENFQAKGVHFCAMRIRYRFYSNNRAQGLPSLELSNLSRISLHLTNRCIRYVELRPDRFRIQQKENLFGTLPVSETLR